MFLSNQLEILVNHTVIFVDLIDRQILHSEIFLCVVLLWFYLKQIKLVKRANTL